jgi:hypothetical protein
LNPGDPLPSRSRIEEAIDKVPGIVASRAEMVCCNGQQPILYIGVEERNEPHIEYYPEPAGSVKLSSDIFSRYEDLLDQIAASLRARNADEDLTNGYSLMADPDSRHIQEGFLTLVAANFSQIHQVLHESADPEQRAAAAYLMQYGPRGVRDAKTISDDLQFALRDPDDNVRRNAMVALRAVMTGARLHNDQEIHIQPTWFVELMNSAVWSDRHNASLALVTLTDKRDPETLQLIRERALPSVLEMARWHDLDHALPPFILAGRISGLTEEEIKAAWVSDHREDILRQAAKSAKKSD